MNSNLSNSQKVGDRNQSLVTPISFLLILWILLPIVSCSEEVMDNPSEIEYETSIMIVPDIQNYTHKEDRFKYLNAIADYYHENRGRFEAILQVGDLTNNNQVWQYENAYQHFYCRFDKDDQLVFCLGNHDYGSNGNSGIRLSNVPESMLPLYDIRMEGTKWENYIKYITLAGKRYGIIVLEFCTRNETLEWANTIISSDTLTPYIVLTHAFLNEKGEMYDIDNTAIKNYDSPKAYKMGDDYKNDSKEIFEKLIYNNINIKLVICGHSLTPSYMNVLSVSNKQGIPVHMIMVNYQHYREGGEGNVGILDISGDSYRLRSFSTYLRRYGDSDIRFGTASINSNSEL